MKTKLLGKWRSIVKKSSLNKKFAPYIIGGAVILSLNLSTLGFCNGLIIDGVTPNQAAKTVTFNLSWENSWRVVTVPFNWDAAWVFVKFRQCGASPTTAWSHGTVSTTLTDHTFSAIFEPTLSDGSAVGIDPSPNNLGVMLRRTNIGVYPAVGAVSLTLNITNIPSVVAGVSYDFKVLGIEMVYITEGGFGIGDNSTACYGAGANAQGRFNGGQSITSENAVTLLGTFITTPFTGAIAANTTVPLPATYPKGYGAFYCMKYEISQNQYCQFLNCITNVASTSRFPGNYNAYRNRTNNNGTPPDIYWSDRPYRAQGYLNFQHVFSYLDWACLRPMTELEYEKICRGSGPVVDCEFVWGNTTVVLGSQTVSTTVPAEDGTEIVLGPAGANANLRESAGGYGITGGDAGMGLAVGGQGPLRVGIYARPTSTTRSETGATYFGVMEMGGNVWEVVINAFNLAGCTGYGNNGGNEIWGDGYLDVAGMYNAPTWPLTSPVEPNEVIGNRGGSFWDDDEYLTVGNRWCIFWGQDCGNIIGRGGRGVR